MKDFFGRINQKIREFMVGRYGADDFSKFLLGATMVFLVLSLIFGGPLFYILAIALLVYSYFRMFSKNHAARAAENEKYREMTAGLRRKLRLWKRRFTERKDYRFFKCPSCGQEVRVPRGKGRIRITCPRCRGQFDRTV